MNSNFARLYLMAIGCLRYILLMSHDLVSNSVM